jgi:ABC-type phosphate/phosphonate transport system substrate-binding protein
MLRLREIGAGMVAAAALLAGLALTDGAGAESSARSSTLRIGVVGTLFRDMPEPMVQIIMGPFKAMIESTSGMTSQLVTVPEPDRLAQDLADDKLQLAVFHGVEFGWAQERHPRLRPLVVAVCRQRTLHAYLLVKRDSRVSGFRELKGKIVALPRQSRDHCRLYLERRCEECGCAAEEYLAKVARPAHAEDAIDDVVDGRVDAAVVDDAGLDRYEQDKAGRFAQLKTAQRSEPFPCGLIAYNPGAIDETTMDRLRDGLLNCNRSRNGRDLLGTIRITALEPVSPEYEKLVVDIVKAYPAPAKSSK